MLSRRMKLAICVLLVALHLFVIGCAVEGGVPGRDVCVNCKEK